MTNSSNTIAVALHVVAGILVGALLSSNVGAQNYPPPQPGYPPQQGGYPPAQNYPPQQSGYPPQQQGNPMQQQQGQQMQPGYPPPQGGMQGQSGYGGGGQPAGQAAGLDELMAWERQDMGVAPTKTLHTGAMHGPTPNQIPGGQVITTKGLVALMQSPQGVKPLVLDVLGAPQQLPDAQAAVPASQPGTFNDQTQQQFGQYLQQATRGNKQTPIVLYCASPQCWMSYNAALRAINLGYKNVLWYRGGLEAWQRAGMQFVSAGQGMPQQGGQGGYAGGQPGGHPGAQPGGYTGGQPGGSAGGQPGGQPGGYPGGQPGGYPGGQPGGYPGGQPGGYPPQPR